MIGGVGWDCMGGVLLAVGSALGLYTDRGSRLAVDGTLLCRKRPHALRGDGRQLVFPKSTCNLKVRVRLLLPLCHS